MTDELPIEEEDTPAAPDEHGVGIAPEVEFVIPADAYGVIATEEAFEPAPTASLGAALAPALEAIVALGETLHRRLDALQAQFDREIRAEATREKVVDRLHAELQEYKQDLLLNVLRPVFVDLIQLHDDMGKITSTQAEIDGEVHRLLDLMRGFQQGIEDILYRQGVEPYTLEGDTFDPRRQRAVATVPTDDPALAKTIAVRHRKGFQVSAGEKMIRPEIVSVYAPKR